MTDVWEWFTHVDWTLQNIDTPTEWLAFASIPLFTSAIGWFINLTGLWMLFFPIHFHGWQVRGLADLTRKAPHKIQEIPGLLTGGIGWQGIVPARAAKMGSIAVDKAIAKIGTPADFYQQLEPDASPTTSSRPSSPSSPRSSTPSCAASTRPCGATCLPSASGPPSPASSHSFRRWRDR